MKSGWVQRLAGMGGVVEHSMERDFDRAQRRGVELHTLIEMMGSLSRPVVSANMRRWHSMM
jgi:hypothetical protein